MHLNITISDQSLCSELFSRIQDTWGIPQEHQMLSFGGSLLQPSQPLKYYNIQDGSSIQLSVKGYGGGEDSDDGTFTCQLLLVIIYVCIEICYIILDSVSKECISCGELARFYCDECKSSRCAVCNDRWHKHPHRRSHATKV